MSINSMTGFAREAGVTGAHRWAWEIKSVNGRGLEIRLRNPPGFDEIGEEARRAIQGGLARGQCQLTLTLARDPGPASVRINRAVLAGLVEAIAAIELPERIRPATMDGLLAVRGVVETEEEGANQAFDETLKADLRAATTRLLGALQAARRQEGEALAGILEGQLGRMERLVGEAEASPGRQPDAIRARLQAQIAPLLEPPGGLDPARLHQEAALIAARADIREELDRLAAHIASARSLLGTAGSVGRRLDFLAQELGREANTLCSKANDVALSQIGLELKATVEQFREQVQNVE